MVFDASLLTSRQVIAITAFNLILMTVNVIANASAIYILIKTRQISHITCKLIFMLSASDLLQGLISQNLLTARVYETSRSVSEVSKFLSVFLSHLSNYIIAIIGVDRYFRIKHYANFKTWWTTKAVLKLMCTAFCLALFKGFLITTGLFLGEKFVVLSIYMTLDGIIICTIIVLQIKTIWTSNAVHNESTLTASQKLSKRVTKLSMRIMLLLCFFFTPHLIMFILRVAIQSGLNAYEKSILEFMCFLSLLLVYANSLANAILFLMTNVKARRFMANFGRRQNRSLKRIKTTTSRVTTTEKD